MTHFYYYFYRAMDTVFVAIIFSMIKISLFRQINPKSHMQMKLELCSNILPYSRRNQKDS